MATGGGSWPMVGDHGYWWRILADDGRPWLLVEDLGRWWRTMVAGGGSWPKVEDHDLVADLHDGECLCGGCWWEMMQSMLIADDTLHRRFFYSPYAIHVHHQPLLLCIIYVQVTSP
ncbi:unnamed protein product [Xylocopa violacea]|uniref:Uncharacterized protein n=1 Tax=Xylocopa violacea TaxID=135666 RepID=A0ABP1N7J7_XYLVO